MDPREIRVVKYMCDIHWIYLFPSGKAEKIKLPSFIWIENLKKTQKTHFNY